MDDNNIYSLTRKIELKQQNNMDTGSDVKELIDNILSASTSSESLTSAIGLDSDSSKELESYIGDAKKFPFRDLELTLDYAGEIIRLLEKELETDTDKGRQMQLISRLACVQWHFNNVSKPLTKEYLTNTPVTSYILISPYMDVDSEMAKKELSDFRDIIENTKNALSAKDLKLLYKCNADIMTVSTNLTQYRYCIDTQ